MNSADQHSQIPIDQIYSIIDTRIQYIDYQTNQIVASIIGIDNADDPKKDKLAVEEVHKFNFAHNNCDSFITMMEEFSKTKRLLLLMRSLLNEKNADLIYNFLNDNSFEAFTEKELKLTIETMSFLPRNFVQKDYVAKPLHNKYKKSSSTN